MLGLPVHAYLVGQTGSTLFSKALVPPLRQASFLTHKTGWASLQY